jgi:Mg-chelatase subunit ChlI
LRKAKKAALAAVIKIEAAVDTEDEEMRINKSSKTIAALPGIEEDMEVCEPTSEEKQALCEKRDRRLLRQKFNQTPQLRKGRDLVAGELANGDYTPFIKHEASEDEEDKEDKEDEVDEVDEEFKEDVSNDLFGSDTEDDVAPAVKKVKKSPSTPSSEAAKAPSIPASEVFDMDAYIGVVQTPVHVQAMALSPSVSFCDGGG